MFQVSSTLYHKVHSRYSIIKSVISLWFQVNVINLIVSFKFEQWDEYNKDDIIMSSLLFSSRGTKKIYLHFSSSSC